MNGKNQMNGKYYLDCENHAGPFQFVLYEDDTVILQFNYEDVPGLAETEKEEDIIQAYNLIDAYITEKLGWLPDYSIW